MNDMWYATPTVKDRLNILQRYIFAAMAPSWEQQEPERIAGVDDGCVHALYLCWMI